MTLDEVELYNYGGVTSLMTKAEHRALWRCAAEVAGRPIIEVGAAYGGTTVLLAAASGTSEVISVDSGAGGNNDADGTPELYRLWRQNVAAAGFSGRAKLLTCDSIEPAKDYRDGTFGLVLLDADHNGTRPYQDLLAWGRKVALNGYLCIDDVGNHFPGVVQSVCRYLCEHGQHFEFVELLERAVDDPMIGADPGPPCVGQTKLLILRRRHPLEHWPGELKWADIPNEKKFSCGLPEWEMGIGAADLAFLNHLIFTHPEYMTTYEFGTYRGITALALGMAMRARGGRLVTIDNNDDRHAGAIAAWLDNMECVISDLLPSDGSATAAIVQRITHAGPCLVFCDGGNKVEELRRYGPVMKPGDCIAVHDWRDPDYESAEISPPRCPPEFFDATTWRPEQWDLAEALGTQVRAWVKL